MWGHVHAHVGLGGVDVVNEDSPVRARPDFKSIHIFLCLDSTSDGPEVPYGARTPWEQQKCITLGV